MLDKKTAVVLRTLDKLTEGNAYKVVTATDILSSVGQRSQFDLEEIKQCVEFLEKQEYINIKFKEENTYCYSLLPKARICLEQESSKTINLKNKQSYVMQYVFIMIASFIGSLLAVLIFFYLTF